MPEASYPLTPGLLGPLFAEAGRGDRTMREALFLTFNVDLGFFEDRLLGKVRETGAAVTVVADASVFDPDPRSVRAAGRGYTFGLAHHAAAFHPKVTVLAGPQRALVGIGSGNLTIGGWHANREILTTIEATRSDGTPRIVTQVIAFLRELVQVIRIGPLARDGIERTADTLAELVAASESIDTGHRLVHSLTNPIIDQLPTGHAGALELAAPFHDEHGHALDALVKRYHPSKITVLVQPGQAVMRPAALQASAGSTPLSFVQPDTESAGRYRHGKVLTALHADGSVAWSLTGSPNLTAAALLRTAQSTPAGNCELGIVTYDAGRLLPTPTVPVTDIVSLHHVLPPRTSTEGDAVRAPVGISEARCTAEGLLVVLSHAAEDDIPIEVSPYRGEPEQFQTLGVIPGGSTQATFPGIYEPGTRVRAGTLMQFVADPNLVQLRLRPSSASGDSDNVTHAQLFADPARAEKWYQALTALTLAHQQPTKTQTGTSAASSTHQPGAWKTLQDEADWNDYADAAQNTLGLPIFQLAVGSAAATMQSTVVGASLPSTAPAWEDRFDDTADTFEEEQTAEEVVDNPPTLVPTSPAPMSSWQRGRYRNWITQLSDLMTQLGPIERIAAAQLVLVSAGAGCWEGEAGRHGWFDPLTTALGALVRDDWPSQLHDQAAGLLAVGLYRLCLATPGDDRGREAGQLHALSSKAAPMMKNVTAGTIETQLPLIDGSRMLAAQPYDVLNSIHLLTVADEDEVLIARVGRLLPELTVEWSGPAQLHARGRTSNPIQTAGRIFDLADDNQHLAVYVVNEKDQWALMVSSADRLLLVDGRKAPVMYTTHRRDGVITPLMLATNPEMRQRTRVSQPPFATPGAAEFSVVSEVPVGQLPLPATVRLALLR